MLQLYRILFDKCFCYLAACIPAVTKQVWYIRCSFKFIGYTAYEIYSEEVIYEKAISSISDYFNLPYSEVLARIDDNYIEIDRATYDLNGDEETQEIEEYLFSFVPVQNNRNIYAKSRNVVLNDYDNDIIVRYNPNNDTVEEFKWNLVFLKKKK